MLWNKASASNARTTNRKTGEQWEHAAEQYLTDQGLSSVTANFHTRRGEIDLIMKEGETLVFIEVKYRKNKNFGGAISSINISKQEKIRKSAAFFLQQQGLNAYNTCCRFDIVAIEGGNIPEFIWLKNAF